MKALGQQLILELHDCAAPFLMDPKEVRRIMLQAAYACGATPIDDTFRQFTPHGVSGVVIISESHLTVHTWPEYGYTAIDIFTCGDDIDMAAAEDCLRQGFKAATAQRILISRGLLDLPAAEIHHKPPPTISEASG